MIKSGDKIICLDNCNFEEYLKVNEAYSVNLIGDEVYIYGSLVTNTGSTPVPCFINMRFFITEAEFKARERNNKINTLL
jgi:hypothetical protein